jgi:hypothetical protein
MGDNSSLFGAPFSAYAISVAVSIALSVVAELVYSLVYHMEADAALLTNLRRTRGSVDWRRFLNLGLPSGVSMAFLGFSLTVSVMLLGRPGDSGLSVLVLLIEFGLWLTTAFMWRTVASRRLTTLLAMLQDPARKVGLDSASAALLTYPIGGLAFFLALTWNIL